MSSPAAATARSVEDAVGVATWIEDQLEGLGDPFYWVFVDPDAKVAVVGGGVEVPNVDCRGD
jgi:hypothetical protein